MAQRQTHAVNTVAWSDSSNNAMPNTAAKYSSEYLTAEQMALALDSLHSVLDLLFGQCTFTATYGWAANLHSDLWYRPMTIHPGVMRWFIEDSVIQRTIVPGQSDLYIESPHNELKLLFCHESDIHVDGESEEMMKSLHGR